MLRFLESVVDDYLAGKISKLKHLLVPLLIICIYKMHPSKKIGNIDFNLIIITTLHRIVFWF